MSDTRKAKNRAAAMERGEELKAGDDTPSVESLLPGVYARAVVRSVAAAAGCEIPGVDPELVEASLWKP